MKRIIDQRRQMQTQAETCDNHIWNPLAHLQGVIFFCSKKVGNKGKNATFSSTLLT